VATASINGVDLFYTEAGSGPPCLVMHGGLGMDHTLYKRSLGPLEDALHLVYYDQRGNGRSSRPPLETITIPQLAEDADALREHLGIDRVAVIGHSYGGFVALEYATTLSDRLSHLITLDTSPGAFEPTGGELAERGDPSWITPEVERALEAFSGPPPASDAEYESQLRQIMPAYLRSSSTEVLSGLNDVILDASAMVRGFEALDGWSVEPQLDQVGCPTLVLCGRYDLFTTPECSARIASRIPGAELVWFERSGHFPWLEEPDAFFAAVKGWLGRHPA